MNNEMIDITLTATLRPSVLTQTLDSFREKLFVDESRYRLIMNVDLVGEDVLPFEIIYIAETYFSNVVYRISKEPSFSKAFLWCWDKVESDIVFHLEEDWKLLKLIDIDNMISILEKNQDLACLRLNKMHIPVDCIFEGKQYEYVDGFLRGMGRDDYFSTNPELLKGKFVKEARKYLFDKLNPEKQFRPTQQVLFRNVVEKWDYGVYAKPGDFPAIWDLGRSWMVNHGYIKEGGSGFIRWVKA